MRLLHALPLVAALVLNPAVPASAAAATSTSPSTLVVDRDGAQCGNAGYTSIQAAVDAAAPGDLVRVCPDLYAESVVVDKPLTLVGDPEAVEALDCFAGAPAQPGDADPTRQVIVDPAGDTFSVAFTLRADDVALGGFIVQGASVGIDAADRFSGYHVHHNVLRLHSLFGMDFGSAGARQSRVDHNCIRENRWGLVSELDDDSLWAYPVVGDERGEWNQRDLANARVDHNQTFRNGAGAEAAGPGRRDLVVFDHNISREDRVGIALQNSTRSAIIDNDISRSVQFPIAVGGGNTRLTIATNVLTEGTTGILVQAVGTFIDTFPAPTQATIAGNTVFRMRLSGIGVSRGSVQYPGDLHGSVIEGNVSSDNGRNGIALLAGNSGNEVRANVTERNATNGIYAAGATATTFTGNWMFGNGAFDARDDARDSNVWTANRCATDFPAGTICGVG